MLTVLEVTLPVFALVLCGWASARHGLMGAESIEGINAFVFWFALPAMLLRAVAAHPVSQIADTRFLSAFLLAALLMFFGSRLIARSLDADSAERTGFAFASTHGNVGYLGLPLIAQLGDPSRMPAMVMAMIVDIFVVIVLAIVLFESARSDNSGGTKLRRLRGALGGLLRTPLILGIAAGLILSVTETTLPTPVEGFVRLLASAAGPCALFAIGASLGTRRVSLDRHVGALIVLKLAVHPALVAGTMILFGVDPALAAIGVLAAALPTASNTFILSQRYGISTQSIGAAIVIGTFGGAATVSFVIWALGLPIG
jgi:predicted permease